MSSKRLWEVFVSVKLIFLYSSISFFIQDTLQSKKWIESPYSTGLEDDRGEEVKGIH